ncbi:MAG: HAMP domain-containing protein [Candidatus Rokubacteria bacterium]|nr:HAMP domain-containing protein [Candidatus Rokubacteria bacterium]
MPAAFLPVVIYEPAIPQWTIVLSEPKANGLAPIASFERNCLLVILLSLWIVLLLSITQIRRSLIPPEQLQEGTRRIARGDFDTRVEVASRDEFEELAVSLNTMAHQRCAGSSTRSPRRLDNPSA